MLQFILTIANINQRYSKIDWRWQALNTAVSAVLCGLDMVWKSWKFMKPSWIKLDRFSWAAINGLPKLKLRDLHTFWNSQENHVFLRSNMRLSSRIEDKFLYGFDDLPLFHVGSLYKRSKFMLNPTSAAVSVFLLRCQRTWSRSSKEVPCDFWNAVKDALCKCFWMFSLLLLLYFFLVTYRMKSVFLMLFDSMFADENGDFKIF